MIGTANKFSPEVRERAVRMVLDNPGHHGSRWQAIGSVVAKVGSANTLNSWGKKAEVDSGQRAGISSDMAESEARPAGLIGPGDQWKEQAKALERENRELRQGEEGQENVRGTFSPTNEILRKGETLSAIGPRTMSSAYFAMAELDRRPP